MDDCYRHDSYSVYYIKYKPLHYEREDTMLDAYIIDQIRRREEERRRINERPALELPLPEPPPPRRQDEAEAESEPKRVVIIDL
jgi:hypothetical protein